MPKSTVVSGIVTTYNSFSHLNKVWIKSINTGATEQSDSLATFYHKIVQNKDIIIVFAARF